MGRGGQDEVGRGEGWGLGWRGGDRGRWQGGGGEGWVGGDLTVMIKILT